MTDDLSELGDTLIRDARIKSMLEAIPDAMIVIDEGGLMQALNATAIRMFGYPDTEVLGRNINMMMPSPYREEHDGYLSRYRETGQRRIIGIGRVVVGERKDGSTFPMELSVGEWDTGPARLFTGLIRDLTERQLTETRLHELQSELVHNSRLTTMGNMASALAHELNQPLSAITNYLRGSRRLVEQGETGARLIEAIDKAGDQALRAGEIIRRLRQFVSNGESERRAEPIAKLIEEASALALVGTKDYGVRARFEIDPSIDLVMVDRVQIQQVLVNLIRNAAEAMQDAPRRVLTISVRPAAKDVALIGVADTGPGLSEEAAANIFRPFVTSKGAQGMGVGLSISRTIVEAHGGSIWVDPAFGGGANFQFTVPRASKESAA